jgi:D-alanyl-D-alanine carboxypeptidase
LSHTGGIPNPIPLAWIHLAAEDDAFDFDAFLEGVLAAHPKRVFAPGTRWSYSNIGFMLLGKAIEAASGERYRDHIRTHVLAPLGLEPRQIDFRTDRMPSHATAYLPRLSFMTIAASFMIDMKRFGAPAVGKWLPLHPFYLDGSPYGGLIANPAAAIAFLRDLCSDHCRLVSAQSKRLLFEPQRTTDGKLTSMTRGWFTGTLDGVAYLTHPGGGGGYYCELRLYPTLAMASVALFNRTGINERFLDTVDRFFVAQPG